MKSALGTYVHAVIVNQAAMSNEHGVACIFLNWCLVSFIVHSQVDC